MQLRKKWKVDKINIMGRGIADAINWTGFDNYATNEETVHDFAGAQSLAQHLSYWYFTQNFDWLKNYINYSQLPSLCGKIPLLFRSAFHENDCHTSSFT